MRRFLLLLLVLMVPASLAAQRGGFGHFSGRATGRFGAGFGRGGYARGGAYGVPFFDPLYADYVSDAGPAPVTFGPRQPAAAEPAATPAQPLLIELRGDRYVQVSGDQGSSAEMMDRPVARSVGATVKVQPEQVPTVLVFRDGRHEEVSDYTIADGVLYASADYYSTGAWNRRIALSTLNLAETVSANRARGVQFRLPMAPNEVIVGP